MWKHDESSETPKYRIFCAIIDVTCPAHTHRPLSVMLRYKQKATESSADGLWHESNHKKMHTQFVQLCQIITKTKTVRVTIATLMRLLI